jgi:hypothetical protein
MAGKTGPDQNRPDAHFEELVGVRLILGSKAGLK